MTKYQKFISFLIISLTTITKMNSIKAELDQYVVVFKIFSTTHEENRLLMDKQNQFQVKYRKTSLN